MGVRRVLIVAAVALAAFVVAIVVLGDEARLGCAVDARPDPAYAARIVGDLDTEATDYEVMVTRDGEPVSGAKVCASLGMVGMGAMTVTDTAVETGRGVYRVSLSLQMSGNWRGDILITEKGRPQVSVPLEVEVH